MDIRILSRFVVILGIAAIFYGGIQYLTNHSKQLELREGFEAGLQSVVDVLGNDQRERQREGALKIMVIGGVVVFAGVAIATSLKKGG